VNENQNHWSAENCQILSLQAYTPFANRFSVASENGKTKLAGSR
jgi:hypothetical protein